MQSLDVRAAAERLFSKAGMNPSDVNVVGNLTRICKCHSARASSLLMIGETFFPELHDCFSANGGNSINKQIIPNVLPKFLMKALPKILSSSWPKCS